MEKRKLLLVSISVGVFLVIVVGASLVFFAPRNQNTTSMASLQKPVEAGAAAETEPLVEDIPASADPQDLVSKQEEEQGIETPPASLTSTRGDIIIIYGDNPAQNTQITPESTDKNEAASRIIAVPSPVEQKQPVTIKETPERSPQPAPSSTTRVQTNPPASVSTAKQQETRTNTAPVQQHVVKTVEDYWVQTGAFSTKVRAENAMEQLDQKGINSIMEVKAINDQTFFRVRVGPYTSKNEADYWLSLIKGIDGFGESYVSMVTSRR